MVFGEGGVNATPRYENVRSSADSSTSTTIEQRDAHADRVNQALRSFGTGQDSSPNTFVPPERRPTRVDRSIWHLQARRRRSCFPAAVPIMVTVLPQPPGGVVHARRLRFNCRHWPLSGGHCPSWCCGWVESRNLRRTLTSPTVTHGTARSVTVLSEELRHLTPPRRTPQDRAAVVATVGLGRHRRRPGQ